MVLESQKEAAKVPNNDRRMVSPAKLCLFGGNEPLNPFLPKFLLRKAVKAALLSMTARNNDLSVECPLGVLARAGSTALKRTVGRRQAGDRTP